MSTIVLVEQRPPFIVMLASRVPTYTNIVISLLAVLLIQAYPSWAIPKPPVRVIARKRRSSSLTSNASTLVDPNEANAAKKDMGKHEKEKSPRVSFPSKTTPNKLNSAVKMAISRSKTIKPTLPRRFSLPARRFSSHIVTAVHNLTPHHRIPQDISDSYFPNEEVDIEHASMADNNLEQNDKPEPIASKPIIVSVTQSTEVENVEGDRGNDNQRGSYVTVETPGKTISFKRVARSASVVFRDLRLHRS